MVKYQIKQDYHDIPLFWAVDEYGNFVPNTTSFSYEDTAEILKEMNNDPQ